MLHQHPPLSQNADAPWWYAVRTLDPRTRHPGPVVGYALAYDRAGAECAADGETGGRDAFAELWIAPRAYKLPGKGRPAAGWARPRY